MHSWDLLQSEHLQKEKTKRRISDIGIHRFQEEREKSHGGDAPDGHKESTKVATRAEQAARHRALSGPRDGMNCGGRGHRQHNASRAASNSPATTNLSACGGVHGLRAWWRLRQCQVRTKPSALADEAPSGVASTAWRSVRRMVKRSGAAENFRKATVAIPLRELAIAQQKKRKDILSSVILQISLFDCMEITNKSWHFR